MRLLRRILIFVLITVILFALAAGLMLVYVENKQQEFQQQLTTLDQEFNQARGEIPPQVNAELFFPEQIGILQREFPISNVYQQCRNPNNDSEPCMLFNTYKSNGEVLYVSISRIANKENLSDKVAKFCDSDDKTLLRTVSHVPYIYYTNCNNEGFYFFPPVLKGASWQNGNWFIYLNGRYDDIRQFIAAYPY